MASAGYGRKAFLARRAAEKFLASAPSLYRDGLDYVADLSA